MVTLVLEGHERDQPLYARRLGATNPAEAAPGTIRADFGLEIGRNLIHASDGPDTAQSETALWFGDESGRTGSRNTDEWIFEE